MQDFATLADVMGAARKREIELQTQSKRKAESTTSKPSDGAQKKVKLGDRPRYEYRPAAKQGDRPPPVCFHCKKEGHHWKECRSPPAPPAITAAPTAPVCYNCQETGHKRPQCPKLNKSGSSNPTTAPTFKGPTMMTQGRAHQLTGDEPPKLVTGNYFSLSSLNCAM